MGSPTITSPPGLADLEAVLRAHLSIPIYDTLDGTEVEGDAPVWVFPTDLTDTPAAVVVPSDPWMAPHPTLCLTVKCSWDVHLVGGRFDQEFTQAWIADAYCKLIRPLAAVGFEVDTLSAPNRFNAAEIPHLAARFAVASITDLTP
jgi:hypothetical protein